MNYTRQVHGESHVYPVPPGLHELVNDITREVLRQQPEDIIKFIAKYLDSLLRIRNSMHVSVKFRAELVDEATKFLNHFLICGYSPDDLDEAATTIQSFWRGFLGRRKYAEELDRRKWEAEGVDDVIRAIAEELNVKLEDLLDAANVIQEFFNEFLENALKAPPEPDEPDLKQEMATWLADELRNAGLGSDEDAENDMMDEVDMEDELENESSNVMLGDDLSEVGEKLEGEDNEGEGGGDGDQVEDNELPADEPGDVPVPADEPVEDNDELPADD